VTRPYHRAINGVETGLFALLLLVWQDATVQAFCARALEASQGRKAGGDESGGELFTPALAEPRRSRAGGCVGGRGGAFSL